MDWVLVGDTGDEPDSEVALSKLLIVPMAEWDGKKQRSHWGTIVFQANEHLDGSSGWAWEQYPVPEIMTITRAQLYQGEHSIAAMAALITALIRVYETVAENEASTWLEAIPTLEWSENSVTHGVHFLDGPTHERPLFQTKQRKPDFNMHTAEDVLRIVNAGDSQPGAQLAGLTRESRTSLFADGAHVHLDSATVPAHLHQILRYEQYGEIPNGRILATRSGSVFIKTKRADISGAGEWITHGRVPKKAESPLDPKVPILQAIRDAGHGAALEGVQEWPQESFKKVEGNWQ